ncbi:hypothetical protein [Micromonospora sp. WMMD987]|uniref:hypothetical protein n=1 Tax=Micromonospora TaxID=1873 RepID=UPI00249ADFC6|nr:hypothetical protein [Micromonospora sp. WMMD987]WFE95265.1 hypothetical protein O7612_28875 [Micromonospora sp. WMMD987]
MTKRFETTGDPTDLDAAITAVLELTEAVRGDRQIYSVACWEAARLVRARVDLAYGRSAALRDGPRGAGDDDTEAAERQARQAEAWASAAADLDLFVSLMRRSVADFPDYSAYVAGASVDLADALTRRFRLRDSINDPEAVTDLTAAIACYVGVLENHQPAGQNLHVCLIALADLHLERHRTALAEPDDLATAESYARRGLTIPDLDPGLHLETMCILADMLVERVVEGDAEHLGAIDEAIGLYEEALRRLAEGDVNRELPRIQANLASAFRLRYLATRDPEALDRQIALLAETLSERGLRWM